MKGKRLALFFLLAIGISSLSGSFGNIILDYPKNLTGESRGTYVAPIEKTEAGKQSTADSREEIIYANLSQDGSVDSLYAVNLLHSTRRSENSSQNVRDYGEFSAVSNLTNTETLTLSGDELSFYTTADAFYYQANLTSKELPWNFRISYTLDGKTIHPNAIAGKSGHLEISIVQEPKTGSWPARITTFSENYMLQTTVTLDRLRCSNISAPKAQIAALGTNNILTFVTMPGKSQTLTIGCNVIGFEMDGISIAAVPFSLSLGDGTADIEKLQDGTSELTKASAEIRDALNTVVWELQNSGMQNTDLGFDNLDLSQLLALPRQLDAIADGIDQVASGTQMLSTNFTQAFGALDLAMSSSDMPDGTIIIDPQDITNAIAEASGLGSSYTATLQQLANAYSTYGAASTAKGTYDAVKPAFSATEAALPQFVNSLTQTSDGLRTMSDALQTAISNAGIENIPAKMSGIKGQLSAQLFELQAGLDELASGYNEFHNGLIEYTDGIAEVTDLLTEKEFTPTSFLSEKNKNTTFVQFVIKTSPIQMSEVSTHEDVTPNTTDKNEDATGFTGVWNRFWDLF